MPQASGSGKGCRCVSAERLASASMTRTASSVHALDPRRSRPRGDVVTCAVSLITVSRLCEQRRLGTAATPLDASALPGSGCVAEVRCAELGGTEAAAPVPDRCSHADIAEADYVRSAVTGQVGEEARVPVDPPASGEVAEVRDGERGRAEGPVAVVERDVDA